MKTTKVTVSIFCQDNISSEDLATLNNTLSQVIKTQMVASQPNSLVLEYELKDIEQVHQTISNTFAQAAPVALLFIDKCLQQEIVAVKNAVQQQMKSISHSIEKCRDLEIRINDYKRLSNLTNDNKDYANELHNLEHLRYQEMINMRTIEETSLVKLNSMLASLKNQAVMSFDQTHHHTHTQHTHVEERAA